MATLKEDLWGTLQYLEEDEFNDFKWFLKQDDTLEGFSAIPAAQLEKAERGTTVDLLVQTHTGPGALKITLKVFEKIKRNDLVQRLQTSSPGPTDLKTLSSGAQKEEYERVKTFLVDVTLDPDTAHPNLILSGDRKKVYHGDVRQKVPDNPERFYRCVNILGKQSLSSGRFYFEVQVKGKIAWTLGVVKKSINRKGGITLSPENGFWTVWLRNGHWYEANDENPVCLSLKSQLQKVGVFVDYEEGLVSFYDADTADHLYSFTGCSFTEKIYPFFSPCTNDGGRNSAPLIICPINHNN
ncbi:E3 ubiquitin-protein ligase TRIM21-like [Dicentrarchus labrax]|uniref:E3 ubiquitin-protein ligase TRIM21-like n=1 Tax=Dicentrarchus labrax TaxID=13489 RepID=UPI0021F50C87|nr:E3 ubiquitin-protein ligase TRIM21-like [Dicentrarchus labrax]XP_051251273.1 E3 ubiquitin-protein ligase TRIM21-like [Dicentrarchus labrax]XP_051251274.1 E3 ubiquitin-protein ligase TRIM21-like [Dicentrarchus labrax]XP_051251275.1 E3 ubiquitin-protein ligase TRIM21-like [Dicentrarchus labrax]XP_051251276.1 E3 ubiquitin-protein ligase TRIM21-like [Dicentrarchus labrax]XP_051251277.1 E3 ubiquitin-protein ligase TRIM21-like [Dicentrarchus labrax]